MSRRSRLIIVIGWLMLAGGMVGCAGPLEQAVRQELNASFVGQRYLTSVYLGSRYHLDYTNNSVQGRDPVGLFLDPSLNRWYATDASFFESGSSGTTIALDRLRQIDRDLDILSFVQGISTGQVVTITRLTDKADQVILEVETLEQYPIRKTYGLGRRGDSHPRASRIHLMFGKEGMQRFDQNGLQRMLDSVLAPLPALSTTAENDEFILSHFPNTSVHDLMLLTGYSEYDVLTRYYASALSRGDFTPAFQQKLADRLARQYALWLWDDGILLNDVRAGAHTIVFDCAIQEMSQSVIYHSPELRAAFLFFNHVTQMLESLHAPFAELLPETSLNVLIRFSYLYVDNFGQAFPEDTSFRFQVADVVQCTMAALDQQELVERTQILVNKMPVSVSLDALKAVERIKYTVPTSWKEVEVEIVDWWYEEDEAQNVIVIQGEVRNTGTWLAEDVTVTVEGYDKYGLTAVEESATVYGFLKPDEIQSFDITINMHKIERLGRPHLTWQAVE